MWGADAFNDDPYGWLTNQCGHALIGLAMATLPLFWAAPIWAVVPGVAAVYFIGWEVLLQRGRLWADSLMDTACVGAGAAFAAALWLHSGWTIAGAALAWGALLVAEWRRRA